MKIRLSILMCLLCLVVGKVGADTATLNSNSQKAFTKNPTDSKVAFSISTLGNWTSASWIGIGDRHDAGYEVSENTSLNISWSVNDGYIIKFSSATIVGCVAGGIWKERNFNVTTSVSTTQTESDKFNGTQGAKSVSITDYNTYFNGLGKDGRIIIGHGDTKMYIQSITITYTLTPITYSVAFNANGGTGTMSNQSFTYDVSQNLTPNAYEKKATVTFDYNDGATANSTATSSATFQNWKNGTATYTDGQSVSNLSSTQGATVTLTAQWSAFSAVTLPTPTREGYKFDGWYNGDTKIDGTTYTPNGNVTLTAHWLEEAYMKIGNSNYGTFCAPFDVTIPDDLDVTIYKESKKITDYIIFSSDESRTIDAYTPVIVYSASPVEKYFYGALRTKDNCGEATLKGNLGTRFVAEEGSYVLNPSSAEKLGIAFKIVNSNTIGVGKNRCYIPAVNAAKLKSMSVVFEDKDDTTVISDLSTIFDSAISSIYSASGSKLEKMQKGINIVKYSDGSIKKVLVK